MNTVGIMGTVAEDLF